MTIHAVYTLEYLCKLWQVPRRTLYFWLQLERRAGRAPLPGEHVTKLVHGKKARCLRVDYARKIQDRYVFRALEIRAGKVTAKK